MTNRVINGGYPKTKRIVDEPTLGELYLFKLMPDCSIERHELKIIGNNSKYYVTRDKETWYKNDYLKEDINMFKSNRVVMYLDDAAAAKEIISKGLFKRMLAAQDKATKALDIFSKFKEVNQ